MALSRGPRDLICSARDCEKPAVIGIAWQNPRIHTGRHKTWLACEEHREFLHQYLELRSFPVAEVPLSDLESASPFPDEDSRA